MTCGNYQDVKNAIATLLGIVAATCEDELISIHDDEIRQTVGRVISNGGVDCYILGFIDGCQCGASSAYCHIEPMMDNAYAFISRHSDDEKYQKDIDCLEFLCRMILADLTNKGHFKKGCEPRI